MKFLSLELSREMHEAGLTSESGFYYGQLPEDKTYSFWADVGYDGGLIVKRFRPYGLADGMNVFNQERDMVFCIPAFTLLDLIAPTEVARSNAKLLFGEGHVNVLPNKQWHVFDVEMESGK